MPPQNDFNLGRHEALIERLVESQSELVVRVTSIEHILAEKRGERRVSLWVLSVASGVVGSLFTLFSKFLHAA